MTAYDVMDGVSLRHLNCHRAIVVGLINRIEESSILTIITSIGIDLAKHVFQIYGIDAHEKDVVPKPPQRGQMIPFFE